MTPQEHPEPVEPVMSSTPDGLYCLVHAEMDCTLPFCWRCGNHELDDFERCTDPRCRASNDLLARKVVGDVKERYASLGRPVPVEVLAAAIAEAYVSEPVDAR